MHPVIHQIKVPSKNIPNKMKAAPPAGPELDPFKDIPKAPYNAKKNPGMQQTM